jgi:hypothetical protein
MFGRDEDIGMHYWPSSLAASIVCDLLEISHVFQEFPGGTRKYVPTPGLDDTSRYRANVTASRHKLRLFKW